eukprot:TRINITY_DN67403_c3_g3_i1.p1 TRINITY_DN67403_c3_g3~~TRINITY_DN67403_c3_g3_i1.p1  ORF type:complete len:570 (+),score=47.10 TRINITY_DN67403_c3_g3_i1:89-1798(+)
MTGRAEKEAGNDAFKNGDFANAADWYSRAIALDPEEHTYFSNRSVSYLRLGRFHKALEDAQKCTKLRPDWAKGWFRVGEAYMGLKLPAKAARAFQESLDVYPHDQHVRACLAQAEHEVLRKSLDDDDDVSPTSASLPTKSTFVGTKRSEILANRSPGPSITSMQDYQRFREAGGAQVNNSGNEEFTTSTYLAELPKNYKPTQSREDFLKQYGIDEKTPTNANQESPSASEQQGSNSNTTSSASSLLAQKRAEFLASIGMSPKEETSTPAGPTSTSTPKVSSGLTGDWAKISGLGNSTSLASPSRSDDQDYSPSMRLRNTDNASGTNSREQFISQMGLDMRGSDTQDYGAPPPENYSLPTTDSYKPQGNPTSSFRRSNYDEDRERHYNELDSTLGMSPGKIRRQPEARSPMGSNRSSPAMSSLNPSPNSTKFSYEPTLGGSSSSSTPKSTSYFAETRSLPQSQTHSATTKQLDTPATPGGGIAGLTTFDYASAGALDGSGTKAKNAWLSDYKRNVGRPERDEQTKAIQNNYSGFSYRKFKEGPAGRTMNVLDQSRVLDNAILADALGEYK